MAKERQRSTGRWLLDGEAVIIFRNTGQVVNHARVLEKSFRVQTPDLGTLTVKTAQVKTIVYKNLPAYPTDMLRTVGSSEFNGEILNDPIQVEAADLGGVARIAKAKIASIIW
jgi:hypothetical protein